VNPISTTIEPLDRREFLRQTLVTATTSAAIGSVTRAPAAGSSLAPTVQKQAELFLEHFVERWLPVQTAVEEANWIASTDVSEAHTAAQVAKNLELNRFVGAPDVIATVRITTMQSVR